MRYSILVVDDESLIARNIAKSIEQVNSSFQVVAMCANGVEAIDYIKNNDVNVVFTDIRMPEMDGLELAEYISGHYPYIECIIVSGYNDFEYAKSAISYNVKNYLLKPVNKEELRKCLSDIERHLRASFTNLENIVFQEKKKKRRKKSYLW